MTLGPVLDMSEGAGLTVSAIATTRLTGSVASQIMSISDFRGKNWGRDLMEQLGDLRKVLRSLQECVGANPDVTVPQVLDARDSSLKGCDY